MTANCPTLSELPSPRPGKKGWPWTEETPPSSTTTPTGEPWRRISIVTPSFNHGDFLERTIRSVLLQGYPNFEYIIIDGGSTDNSIEIIRKYERWLTFWTSEPDCGTSHALNKGFAHASGDLLGIMCADDVYLAGGILKLAQLGRSHPNSVALVGACPKLGLDGKVVHEGVPFIGKMEEIGDWGVGAWFNSVACLFDADSFRQVGQFDERFLTANDVELWIRLAKVGQFTVTDQAVAMARYDPHSLSNRDKARLATDLIAMNCIHGHIDCATAILSRYVARQVPNAIRQFPMGDVLKMFAYRDLLKGFLWRTGSALRGRLRRTITR
jgi:glycosyltransferase involved in cell wall biosynthesis